MKVDRVSLKPVGEQPPIYDPAHNVFSWAPVERRATVKAETALRPNIFAAQNAPFILGEVVIDFRENVCVCHR